jgi:hypothetical protein
VTERDIITAVIVVVMAEGRKGDKAETPARFLKWLKPTLKILAQELKIPPDLRPILQCPIL